MRPATLALNNAPMTHGRAVTVVAGRGSCAESDSSEAGTSRDSESQTGSSLAACSDNSSRSTGKKLGCTEALEGSSSVWSTGATGATVHRATGAAGATGATGARATGSPGRPFIGSAFSQDQQAVALTPLEALQAGHDTKCPRAAPSDRSAPMAYPFHDRITGTATHPPVRHPPGSEWSAL